jgi:hypothetical protein
MLQKWLDARVKYRIGIDKSGSTDYLGLDPESHVFKQLARYLAKVFFN